MTPKEQEKEVMEYLEKEMPFSSEYYPLILKYAVKAILRKYDLFAIEDEPRE